MTEVTYIKKSYRHSSQNRLFPGFSKRWQLHHQNKLASSTNLHTNGADKLNVDIFRVTEQPQSWHLNHN